MLTARAAARALACAPILFATGLFASPALAQAAANPADVLAPTEREAFTFTLRTTAMPDLNAWALQDAPALELSAGDKWRFTFDLDNRVGQGADRLDLESLRAGAFFDVTPRMRLGGALSFSGEDDAITRASGGAFSNDVPEVKFESAFKF